MAIYEKINEDGSVLYETQDFWKKATAKEIYDEYKNEIQERKENDTEEEIKLWCKFLSECLISDKRCREFFTRLQHNLGVKFNSTLERAAIYWALQHKLNGWNDEFRNIIRKKKEVLRANKYLNSPFAKRWLKKMQYTIREDEYGHKFLFLAILCGYNKISDESFNKICEAICWKEFEGELKMSMWIGGAVNWTMFYERPHHINGHETFFSGVVCEDDFSPEDFDKDHSEYSFERVR